MVHKLRRVAGKMTMVLSMLLGMAVTGLAQEPTLHYWHQGIMPPGAIGSRQLQRGGPLLGFFQPVEIQAPAGVSISLADANQFSPPQDAPRRVGLLIGSVYRLRVTHIPQNDGQEVFPTIEVIDRTFAPTDQQVRFAIHVEITREDMELALSGRFVTRVIYLEDPHNAAPVRSSESQSWFDIGPGGDPLAVADRLGRPVAILRLGGRVPDASQDASFMFGSPPWISYPPRTPGQAKPTREMKVVAEKKKA